MAAVAAEPEQAQVEGEATCLTLTVTPEALSVSGANPPDEFLLLARLKAPAVATEERQPVDLIAVIDRSGSMAGDRIKLVKEAVCFMIDQLESSDRLALVTYDSTIETVFDFVEMDDAAQTRAKAQVNSVTTRGCTNLCGGLLEALRLMHKRGRRNPVSSVLLFTDGLANEGLTTAPQIIQATESPSYINHPDAANAPGIPQQIQGGMYRNIAPPQQLQQQQQPQQQQQQGGGSLFRRLSNAVSSVLGSSSSPPAPGTIPAAASSAGAQAPGTTPAAAPEPPTQQVSRKEGQEEAETSTVDGTTLPLPCTINTFGFGSGHDANLLRAIAEHGSGLYYYIENPDNIARAFTDCLAGLLSLVAENVEMTIHAAGDALLVELMTEFPCEELEPQLASKVKIPDIQAEEMRNVVVRVKLPRVSQDAVAMPVLRVRTQYKNLLLEPAATTTVEATCAIDRPLEGAQEWKREPDVDVQHNRIVGARAMREAMAEAQAGRLANARKVMEETRDKIAASDSRDLVENQGLCGDMGALMQTGLASESAWKGGGLQAMSNQSHAHAYERVSHSGWGGQERYQTSARTKMKSLLKKSKR